MTKEENAQKTEVKGSVLSSIPDFIQKRFGAQGLEKWLDTISTDAYIIYGDRIKPDAWYPVKTALIEPMSNIAQLFFNWDIRKAAWQLGRHSADHSVGGWKKLLFRVGSTTFFLQKAAEFMNTYYRPARLAIHHIQEGNGILHIPYFPQIEKSIEYRIAGWIERVLEIAGNENIDIRIPRSLTDINSYRTEIQVHWK